MEQFLLFCLFIYLLFLVDLLEHIGRESMSVNDRHGETFFSGSDGMF